QVPALMQGKNVRGLTVVISPLQSLMKDQIDNLEKLGITDAVTINGLLDPIERAKSIERVEDGSASILYIAPESLRSNTIERLLLGRNVVRFVIDEAHCLSSWGQDFRVDYLYIADFIKILQEKKHLEEGIPVSCFTATAKPKVVEDICQYFKDNLSTDLEIFPANAARVNLRYDVFEEQNEEEKYHAVRNLISEKNCPTIIYVSRTRKAYDLAKRLTEDGFEAKPYHGKMEKEEKSQNQDAFINGEVQIMVATSAFGMGVDKKDVGMVIHYEISDSLENYIQEAGRAGRDENITADCYILFNDDDLSKHFILLNQTKITLQEINQVWKAVKELTKVRAKVSQSAWEIANMAGWNEGIENVETRVRIAISALETAGYLKRSNNSPRVFANSINANNAAEAISQVNDSNRFDEKQKTQAAQIISRLFTDKNSKQSIEDATVTRVDHLADVLGMERKEVIRVVNLLRLEKIISDDKDLIAYISKEVNSNRSLKILESYQKIEEYLLTMFTDEPKTYHLKELNELGDEWGCQDINPNKIMAILNIWEIMHWVTKKVKGPSNEQIEVCCSYNREDLEEKLLHRHEMALFIAEYLYSKSEKSSDLEVSEYSRDKAETVGVVFSEIELLEEYHRGTALFNRKITLDDIEDALFYLSKIDSVKIAGGFMVIYSPMTIERLEKDNRKRYKNEDYQKLSQFYESKMQQIHIVGEYCRMMIENYKAALTFVDDYFQLKYDSFINKYFKGSRQNELKRNITPAKFKELFGTLSPTQLSIINDKESKYIVVAAGPGSGKTRILVHKLASLLLMEDIKQEQLLMVTFSRSSATEFKKRLLKLIGGAANYVEIKTFHSYCFDILGRVGTLEKSNEIIKEATAKILNGEVEASRITKTVLVIDEAQDMDADEYALIWVLMERNEEMRVIAVGDDDQNIYEFRGSSSEYLKQLSKKKGAVMYELVENYRSKSNLVDFSNQFLENIPQRLKRTPIIPVQSDIGTIKIIQYKNSNLITPLVNNILAAELIGSTCILTKTNEEALQITGLLLKEGMQAKLIQSNEGFSLYNLLEIRFFLDRLTLEEGSYTIDADVWNQAKRDFKERFRGSLNYDLITNSIKDFEAINPKSKYKTDLEIFIRESKMEDFTGDNIETIYVSTMHKAKGREFDNVYLMLDGFQVSSDEAKRLLYVAMTRAKTNLTIHYNGNYIRNIRTEGIKSINDTTDYLPPSQLAMQLSHKHIWLDYFGSRQNMVSQLNSGEMLAFDGETCFNAKGVAVLKVSKLLKEQIEPMMRKNYRPHSAKVRFMVYWQKEDADDEIIIVLPEIYFEKP
ncbi:MAG: ATP-dependent helicase, RecQ family, partial [Firmicutes bacterium]|nr:ATP-dependent helicase, RecQ family [Bacillota bacterium]